jgi:uncharacterized protein (DUF2249 family)/quercetin dioxygenase-like cupin family protein
MAVLDVDVREVPKPRKHPLIFERFAALGVGESFVLINNHDPKHLRREFDTDHRGTFGWDYLQEGPDAWRIRISRLASSSLPEHLCQVHDVLVRQPPVDAAGAIWRLELNDRQLDANIIHLPPAGQIGAHDGPDLDVLMLILAGDGIVGTDGPDVALNVGALVWLPRLSRRSITAGSAGLNYLTVHPRRPALTIDTADHR